MDRSEMFHQIKDFSCTHITHNISIRFKGNENKELTEEPTFKSQKKKWTPNKIHHTELEKVKTKMKEKSYNNLTKSERTSMKKLYEQEDIIITKADIGGVVAIVAVINYKKEAERRLSNNDNYRKLQ